MNKHLRYIKSIITVSLSILLIILNGNVVIGQTNGDYRFGPTTGNWGVAGNWTVRSGSTWVTTSTYPGQSAAFTGTVYIPTGRSVTVNVSPYSIGNLIFEAGTSNTTLTISSTYTLTVSGTVTMNAPTSNRNYTIAIGTGTLSCSSLTMETSTGDSRDCRITITTGTLNISGNLIMKSAFARHHIDMTGAAKVNIGGNINNGSGAVGGGFTTPPATSIINLNGTTAQTVFLYGGNSSLGILKINNTAGVTSGSTMTVNTLTVGDLTSNSVFSDGGYQLTSTGTLNLTSGTFKLGSTTTATTFPAFATRNITSGTTVEYASGAAQTVSTTPSYSNLTFSGSGTKTTASGTLTVGGNWTIGSTTFLNTNNTTVNLTGNFTKTANVTVGSGTINISGNWTDNGGTFTPGSGTVNFTGSSTAINGTAATQGFNNIIVNKTSGQTLSVGGSTTTLNVGGTFTETQGNFAAPATMSVAGDITLTAGTFTAGTNLTASGNWTNNGGTFTAGTGTVTLDGTTQSLGGSAGTSFNNLTLSGSGTKTLGVITSIGGNLSIGTGVVANLGTALTHSANTLTLGTEGVLNGIWGSTSSSATYQDDTFFASTGKVDVTVSNCTPPTVSITGSSSICPGGTTTLSPTTGGTWTSNNPTVASVTNAGAVTGLSAGSATFTFRKNSSKCSNTTSAVTVNALPTISGNLTVCAGSTTQLTGSGTPAASNPWVSGTTGVATVNSSGLVTGVSSGTSLITYTNNLGCSKSETVTVNPNVLSVTPASLDFGFMYKDGTSSEMTYTMSSTCLSGYPGNIAVTAPTGFEVSLTSGSGFASYVNVPYSSSTLANTTIYVRFKPTSSIAYSGNITNAGGGATTQNVAVTGTADYCSAGAGTCREYISNVQVDNINNSSTCTSGGYANYTSQSVGMVKGTDYTITVTNGLSTSGDQCGIWVDWNKDGDFIDTYENISVSGGPAIFTATITPPVGAVLGNTRMRVRVTYTDTPSPCANASYGEVEDYTINVCTSTSAVPVAGTATGISCTQFTANWSAASGATTYYLDVSTSNTFSSFVTGYNYLNVGNVTTYNVTGLSPGVTYYYRVRSGTECGASGNSSVISCTTSPLPDAAGSITGTSIVSYGQTGVAYSVGAVTNATSYTWSYSGTGVTINNGTTNNITIDFSGSATSGNLTVRGTNSCGNGTVSVSYPVTITLPVADFSPPSQLSAAETGTMTITVQLNTSSPNTITVPFTLSGSATLNTDYSISPASQVTIAPGNTSATITITITDDTNIESNETVIVTMDNPTNATKGSSTVHTATINDDDNTTPSIVLVFPGSRCGNGTVNLSAVPSGGATVNWYSSATGGSSLSTGNDFTTPSLTATTIYYVDATKSGNTSTPRISVTAHIIESPTITAGGGGTFCSGETINLTSSSGSISNQIWTGPNSFYSQLQNPTITGATSVNTGTYTVTGSQLSGVNLVANGDFESGSVGFSSSYTYVAPATNALWPEGTYTVAANPISVHNNFVDCGDHTSGSGLQMVINGASTANVVVWSQTVNVNPNTDYQFTYWIQSVEDYSPSQLQLYINNSEAGPIYTATITSSCSTAFAQYTYNWNSGSATSAILSLINKNTAPSGNDFALDDIVFQQACSAAATVEVTVNNQVTAGVIGNAQTICSGAIPASITSTTAGTGSGTITYEWQSSTGGAYSTISDATSATFSPPALTVTTSYQRRTKSVNAGKTCYSSYTSPITITVSTHYATAGGPDQACQSASPSAIILTGASVGGGATTGAWSIVSGGGTLSSTAQTTTPATVSYTPAANYAGSVTLRLTTPVIGTCAATSDRIITINSALSIYQYAPNNVTRCQGAGTETHATSALNSNSLSYSLDATTLAFPGNSIDSGTGAITFAAGWTGTSTITATATGCNSSTAVATRTITTINAVGFGTLTSGDETICNGGDPTNITFATTPSGGSGTFTYQWYYQDGLVSTCPSGTSTSGWTLISGATGSSYDPPTGLMGSRSYAVMVDATGTPDCGSPTWASGCRKVTVYNTVSYGTLTSGDETVCNGGDPSNITFATSPSGGFGTFSYQWYYQDGLASSCPSGTSTSGWTSISGATDSSYDPPTGLTASRSYAVMVDATGTPDCGSATWASGCRKVTVLPNFTVGAINTTGETICSGGNPMQIGSATAASGGDGAITYKWQANGADISGATSATYDPPTGLTVNTTYTRWVKDGTCNTTFTQSTGSWIVTINPLPTLSGATQSTTVCTGSSATINLTGLLPNSTSTVSYSINGTAQTPVTGVVADGSGAASFSTVPLSAGNNGQPLQITGITITNVMPNCSKAFTQNVTMSVDPSSSGGTVASDQTIFNGSAPANLTLSNYTGSVVKWQSSTDIAFTSPTDIAETGATLAGSTIGALNNGTYYFRAVVQNGSCPETYSSQVTIEVIPPPFDCSNDAFLSEGDYTLIKKLQLQSGAVVETSPVILSGQRINAIGYNPLDNYIWGSLYTSNNNDKIIRIGSDYSNTIHTITGIGYGYPCGVIGGDGIYYLYKLNTTQIERVDLNPSSGTYMQKLSPIVFNPLQAISIADLNFIGGYIYAVSISAQVYKINISNGDVIDLGAVSNLPSGIHFGASYTDNAGNIYVTQNESGKIYRIEASSGYTEAYYISTHDDPPAGSVDGTRCAVPLAILAIPDVYNICTSGGSTSGSVIENDEIGGAQATTSNVTLSQIASSDAGISLNTSTGVITVAAGTAVGTYTLEYKISGGSVEDNAVDTVYVRALPDVPAITGTTSVCIGSTTALSNTTTGGVWSSETTSVATVDSNTGVVTGVSAGTSVIKYKFINEWDCEKEVSTTVTVNASPSVSLAVNDAAICKPASGDVTITITSAQNGINYELKTLDGASLSPTVSGTGTGSDLNLTILQANAPTATTTYKVMASIAGCTPVELTDKPIITVDVTNPVISNCPSNQNLELTTECSVVATWTPPTASDNCGTPILDWTIDVGSKINANSASVPVGTSTITYTATDSNSNTTTCTFTITVADHIKPVIASCPANTTVSTLGDVPVAMTTALGLGATDNCVISTVTHNDVISLSCPRTITRTYTVTDVNGNAETCQQVITITNAPCIEKDKCQGTLNSTNLISGLPTSGTGVLYNQSVAVCGGTTYEIKLTGVSGTTPFNFDVTLDGEVVNDDAMYIDGSDYVFKFKTGPSASSVTFVLRNNDTNSLTVSAISFAHCGPTVSAAITEQPVCLGSLAELTATVTGSGSYVYQWQHKARGIWADIANSATVSGATTTKLSLTSWSSGLLYRILVSETSAGLDADNCLIASSSVSITPSDDEAPIYQEAFKNSIDPVHSGGNYTYTQCDNGINTFNDLALQSLDVIDNCTLDFDDLIKKYSITNGINDVANVSGDASAYSFPVGTSTVVYTAQDAIGNVATFTFTVVVNQNPELTDVTTDGTVSADGSGYKPYQGSGHTYTVNGGTATAGSTYTWAVLDKDDNVLTAGSANTYTINTTNPAAVVISWGGSIPLTANNYRIRITESGSNSCQTVKYLSVTILENTFNAICPSEQGNACHTVEVPNTIVHWDLTKTGGANVWYFSYKIFIDNVEINYTAQGITPIDVEVTGGSFTLNYQYQNTTEAQKTLRLEIYDVHDFYDTNETSTSDNSAEVILYEVPTIQFD